MNPRVRTNLFDYLRNVHEQNPETLARFGSVVGGPSELFFIDFFQGKRASVVVESDKRGFVFLICFEMLTYNNVGKRGFGKEFTGRVLFVAKMLGRNAEQAQMLPHSFGLEIEVLGYDTANRTGTISFTEGGAQ